MRVETKGFLRARASSARGLAVLLALGLGACGGGTSPAAPSPAAGPTRADITINATNPVVDFSSRAGFNYELTFNLTVTEKGGLGANFNFIRAEFFTAGGTLLERQEVTATQLGRVPPSQSSSAPILIGFNSDPLSGRYSVITCSFTDERANNLTPTLRINF